MRFKSKNRELEIEDETVISIVKLFTKLSLAVVTLFVMNAAGVSQIMAAWPY